MGGYGTIGEPHTLVWQGKEGERSAVDVGRGDLCRWVMVGGSCTKTPAGPWGEA